MTQLQYLDDVVYAPSMKTAVAIGVFDGVHRGHQEILTRTVTAAHAAHAVPIALTFDIHPEDLVAPSRAPGYVCTLEQRRELIQQVAPGIESIVVVRFTREFASLSPHLFTSSVLSDRLRARHVLVGEDFHYGHARSGTLEMLAEDGMALGYGVTVVPAVQEDGHRISSTRIRSLIAGGEIDAAANLLGHPFSIRGVVVTGKKLGRTLGFPTANLQPDNPRQVAPANGVYAAYAELADGRGVPAAVSVGTNPTTDHDGLRKIEAFLLGGFNEDLYGQSLTLRFVRRLREERKFDSLDSLVAQMNKDVAEAAAILG